MSLLCVGSVWIGALGALASPDGRGAAEPPGLAAVLIDRSLEERPVRVMEIGERGLTYVDAEGLVRTEPVEEYVALLAAGGAGEAGAEASVLELVDGQRLIGAPVKAAGGAGGAGGADSVGWVHPVFGALEVPIDRVLRIGLAEVEGGGGGAGPGAALDDVVVLANGDRLEGFVEGIGASVRLETGGQTLEVPLERAAEIRLANPPEGAEGTVVWLADGTVVRVRDLRTSPEGELRFGLVLDGGEESEPGPGTLAPVDAPEGSPSGWTGRVRLGDVRAVAFDAGALVPVAGLAAMGQRPLGERRWTRPVEVGEPGVLGVAEVTLPGPMSVVWELPPGALRLALEAKLPETMWMWGDCELVIAAEGARGEAEVFSARLNAEHPAASVNAELPEGTRRVRVSVKPGAYGPVQDRVVLRRAVVLVEGGEPGA